MTTNLFPFLNGQGSLLGGLGQQQPNNNVLQALARMFPHLFGGQNNPGTPSPPPTVTPPPTPQPPPGSPPGMTTVQEQLMRAYSPQQAALLAGSWRPGMPPAGTPPAGTAVPSSPLPQPSGQPQGQSGYGGGIQEQWPGSPFSGGMLPSQPPTQSQPSPTGGQGGFPGGLFGLFGRGQPPPNPAQGLINNNIFPLNAVRG